MLFPATLPTSHTPAIRPTQEGMARSGVPTQLRGGDILFVLGEEEQVQNALSHIAKKDTSADVLTLSTNILPSATNFQLMPPTTPLEEKLLQNCDLDAMQVGRLGSAKQPVFLYPLEQKQNHTSQELSLGIAVTGKDVGRVIASTPSAELDQQVTNPLSLSHLIIQHVAENGLYTSEGKPVGFVNLESKQHSRTAARHENESGLLLNLQA